MQIGLVALELTTADLTEGDTRTVVRIDIGSNLEDKARKLLLLRLHLTLFGFRRPGTGGNLHKTVQQFLYTEVIQGRTEEHGGHLSRTIGLHIKFRIDAIHQFQILTQFGGILLAHSLVEFLTVDIHLYFIRHTLLVWCKEVEFLFVDIIHTLELCALVNRP